MAPKYYYGIKFTNDGKEHFSMKNDSLLQVFLEAHDYKINGYRDITLYLENNGEVDKVPFSVLNNLVFLTSQDLFR